MYSWIAAVHGDAQRSIEKFFAKLLPRKVCRFCKKGIQRSPIDAGFGSADDSPLVESNLEPRRNSEPVRPTFANGASTSKLHGAPRPIGPYIAAHGFGVTSTSPTLRRGVWRDIRRGASAGSNGPQARPSKVRYPGQTGKHVLILMLTGF